MQGIDMRGLEDRIAVAGKVAVALIIGDHNHHVGTFGGRRGGHRRDGHQAHQTDDAPPPRNMRGKTKRQLHRKNLPAKSEGGSGEEPAG
jgi:hypothetical protein